MRPNLSILPFPSWFYTLSYATSVQGHHSFPDKDSVSFLDALHFDWVPPGKSLLASPELLVQMFKGEGKEERKRIGSMLAPGHVFLILGFLKWN